MCRPWILLCTVGNNCCVHVLETLGESLCCSHVVLCDWHNLPVSLSRGMCVSWDCEYWCLCDSNLSCGGGSLSYMLWRLMVLWWWTNSSNGTSSFSLQKSQQSRARTAAISMITRLSPREHENKASNDDTKILQWHIIMKPTNKISHFTKFEILDTVYNWPVKSYL